MNTLGLNETSGFRKFFNGLIDFVYPPVCIVTEAPLPKDNSNPFVSDSALGSLPSVDNYSLLLISLKINCVKVNSLYIFEEKSNVQTIIHHLKYRKMRSVGVLMGNLLAEKMKDDFIPGDSILLPVPLHPAKFRERGYNQSFFIAKGISDKLNIPIIEDLVRRIKNTRSQTQLSDVQRMENVRGAFEVDQKLLQDLSAKEIILVDDVITTGSTINEIKRVLNYAGIEKISAVSIGVVI